MGNSGCMQAGEQIGDKGRSRHRTERKHAESRQAASRSQSDKCPKLYRHSFCENKPKTLVFNDWIRALWACFHENAGLSIRAKKNKKWRVRGLASGVRLCCIRLLRRGFQTEWIVGLLLQNMRWQPWLSLCVRQSVLHGKRTFYPVSGNKSLFASTKKT